MLVKHSDDWLSGYSVAGGRGLADRDDDGRDWYSPPILISWTEQMAL